MNLFYASILQLRDNVLGRKFQRKLQRPYMLYREQAILEELINNLQPDRVLEWGCGYSTIHFSKLLKPTGQWVSVESKKEWVSKISLQNKRPGVHILLADQSQYVNSPKDRGPFDCIIIDGELRNECLKTCAELLSERGVVWLHDANRTQYHSEFRNFKYQWILTDYRRSAGGVAVFSNYKPVGSFVDTLKYEREWKFIRNWVAKIMAI